MFDRFSDFEWHQKDLNVDTTATGERESTVVLNGSVDDGREGAKVLIVSCAVCVRGF